MFAKRGFFLIIHKKTHQNNFLNHCIIAINLFSIVQKI